jgi:hypothetical protein
MRRRRDLSGDEIWADYFSGERIEPHAASKHSITGNDDKDEQGGSKRKKAKQNQRGAVSEESKTEKKQDHTPPKPKKGGGRERTQRRSSNDDFDEDGADDDIEFDPNASQRQVIETPPTLDEILSFRKIPPFDPLKPYCYDSKYDFKVVEITAEEKKLLRKVIDEHNPPLPRQIAEIMFARNKFSETIYLHDLIGPDNPKAYYQGDFDSPIIDCVVDLRPKQNLRKYNPEIHGQVEEAGHVPTHVPKTIAQIRQDASRNDSSAKPRVTGKASRLGKKLKLKSMYSMLSRRQKQQVKPLTIAAIREAAERAAKLGAEQLEAEEEEMDTNQSPPQKETPGPSTQTPSPSPKKHFILKEEQPSQSAPCVVDAALKKSREALRMLPKVPMYESY